MSEGRSLDWDSLTTAELDRIEAAFLQWNLLPDAHASENLSEVLSEEKLVPFLRQRLEELSTVGEYFDESRPSDELEYPERIGPVNITGVIARGVICDVFRGEQNDPRRQCAIKLQHGARSNPRAKRGFRREVGILAKLDHPYIAKVFFAGEEVSSGHHQMYYAMEYIDGIKLSRFTDEKGLSVNEIVALFINVCEGMGHAHQGGVIHRDLKPANIMVRHDGVPKILDFGIATWNEASATQHSQYGSGTPGYMSPEQFVSNSRQDTRSDIFSLGVILYQLLSGCLPYEGTVDSMVAAARAIATGYRVPIRSRCPECPKDLAAIVDQCLNQEPEDRYQSVQALADDLTSFLCEEPVKARSWHWAESTRRFVSKYRWITATSALALLFLIVGLAVSFSYWRFAEAASDELERNFEELENSRDQLVHELVFRDRSAVNHTLATSDRNWRQSPDLVLQWLQDSSGGQALNASFAERVQWHRTIRTIRQLGAGGFPVTDLDYSPDGAFLLSVESNGHVILWDLSTGESIWKRELGIHEVPMCQFREDGAQVLIIDNGMLKILNAKTGITIRQIDDPSRRAEAAAYSTDGQMIASWGSGQSVIVWNAELDTMLQSFDFSSQSLSELGFTKNCAEVVAATPNGRLFRGGIEGGDQVVEKFEVQRAHSASIAKNANVLALAHLHENLYLFDIQNGNKLLQMQTRGERVDALALSNSGEWMMSATRRQLVARNRKSGWQKQWSRRWNSEPVAMSIAPSEMNYAVGLADGTILHNSMEALPLSEVLAEGLARPQRLGLTQDGQYVVVSGDLVSLIDLAADGGNLLGSATASGTALDAGWSDDGRLFVAAGKQKKLMAATQSEVANGQLNLVGSLPRSGRRLAIDSERGHVLVAMAGGGIEVFDLHDLQDRLEYSTSKTHLNALAVDQKSGRFACGGDDGTIGIWENDGATFNTLNAHSAAVTDLTFSPDGERLFSCSRDFCVKIFNTRTLDLEKTIEVSLQRVRAIDVSPDGESLAIAGADHDIVICDARTGEFQATLKGHTDSVVDVAFTPDNSALISLSSDGTMRRWRPQTPVDFALRSKRASRLDAIGKE